jgi:lipooligosaccharide transport system permease protein
MQTASFESSFPISGKMTWRRNYEAITATPMRVVDLVLGELAWIAVRLSTVAVAFTAVITAFGLRRRDVEARTDPHQAGTRIIARLSRTRRAPYIAPR